MKSCTPAAIVMLVGVTAAAQQPAMGTPPGRLIDVGGYKLHIHCVGDGTPTVVIDGGAGAWSIHFTHIQQALSRARVCTYDRAGLGWSDAGLRILVVSASRRRITRNGAFTLTPVASFSACRICDFLGRAAHHRCDCDFVDIRCVVPARLELESFCVR